MTVMVYDVALYLPLATGSSRVVSQRVRMV